MNILRNLPVADHDIRLALKNWLDELGDVMTRVLVVGVRVHNDVRAQTKGGLNAGDVGFCQSTVGGMLHHVIRARFQAHTRGIVA